MSEDPGTLEELRSHLHLAFPVHSWDDPETSANGTVVFTCIECHAVAGPYASQQQGDVALKAENDATLNRFRTYLEAWAERHRDLAPKGTKFFMLVGCGPDQGPDGGLIWREDDFPRRGVWREGDRTQRGLAEVVLSRQNFAGALTVSAAALETRFDVTWERSFIDESACDIAYVETKHEAFTLVHWDDSAYVEVHATIVVSEPGLNQGTDELSRFLELAGLTWDDVHFPRRPTTTP
ncbi:hypothetical protein acdb102_41260 [Acidothermaceae bacterium B102]|nr:hypothetical protein acdb102_41260 [Acidothermaceae bacterium B102]